MSLVTEVLTRLFEACQYTAGPSVLERFEGYHRLLTGRNRMMDLSNVPDAEMPERHYADSVLPLLMHRELIRPGDTVLDVGSGAGLPGIPLAILLPDCGFVLLEANGRRCAFLREVVEELGLSNVRVLESRAETAGRDGQYREKCDVTVSRAVAGLPELLEYMLPLTKVGGQALCWKGRRAEEEMRAAVRAAELLGGAELTALPYGPAGESILVCAEKRAATPAVYPRREGIPHKRPIV